MLSLQTITTVSPIRSDEELAQAHQRLDELIASQAYSSSSQEVRDEFEVLTALIFYYEQRTKRAGEFDAASAS
ncbi:hypothetical protein [Hymenobacter weizhouensis]|uniref:hypothetical protein n=1 Tax=Hymenobacter sp. YIM 151500-1 TaxID=2987689 RepID=UPI002227D161|nr:hypothetical protein [Hymenobacter sp. YIM 151500-1]UYZ61568.1 hypothetical protein OIS53_11175 [Hymenobacter sp. YIM 151500-1]